MYEKEGHRIPNMFSSRHSRITAVIITFFTTLFTLSVFFYLSITPSSEFSLDQQEDQFSIHHYQDEGNLNIFESLKKPNLDLTLEGWKTWLGLNDGRNRKQESRDIRKLISVFNERFPTDDEKPSTRSLNSPTLERLAHCIETKSCGEGEETVVILASFHFNNAYYGATNGEDIWARSSLEAFHSLNYTLLYTFSAMDTLTIYQGLKDKVKTILWEGSELKKCLARNQSNWEDLEVSHTPGTFQNQSKDENQFGCIRKPDYPQGIPLEKSFTFHFWSGPENPLGRHFTLSPENYAMWNGGKGNHYLGYSIETKCKAINLPSSRKHRGMVLGKYAQYFNMSSSEWAWGKEDALGKSINAMPEMLNEETNQEEKFEMIATGGHDDNEGHHEDMYKGIKNLGSLPQHEWYQTLASSKFLLGVGKPRMSPSPYDALCFGVPFINPVMRWNKENPSDWTEWYAQHDALRPYGPPYVYHVQKENQTQLENAMKAAIENPIQSFIPPPMSKESVRIRHQTLVETDWKPWAIAAVKELWTGQDKEFPYLI
ncbi:uncharacterized protein L201_002767 [Kwoniella dendrophila CBS 6074]|uniref:alpha-1,6-mannosyl-glycoprotein 6-beta-N-acetylglucosaminyltransferase n=1 Tax=Kwoniella dendrophila CBS 6074 TaxID=1295534 RepID=A0AAX4JRB0_9TREE